MNEAVENWPAFVVWSNKPDGWRDPCVYVALILGVFSCFAALKFLLSHFFNFCLETPPTAICLRQAWAEPQPGCRQYDSRLWWTLSNAVMQCSSALHLWWKRSLFVQWEVMKMCPSFFVSICFTNQYSIIFWAFFVCFESCHLQPTFHCVPTCTQCTTDSQWLLVWTSLQEWYGSLAMNETHFSHLITIIISLSSIFTTLEEELKLTQDPVTVKDSLKPGL